MHEQQKIRILLVDDHQIFREGVKRVLQMEDDFDIIGEGNDGEEALQIVSEHQPDVILMDINMPKMNGVEATERIFQEAPNSKVIVLSIHDDEAYVYKTLQSGAKGYLLKDMDVDALIAAIREVNQGRGYIHPKITGQLIDEFRRLRGNSEVAATNDAISVDPVEYRLPYHLLTKRECEVLQLMADGKSNKVIGEMLYISEKTVKNHVSSVLQKMKVNDRTHAVVEAIKQGWVKIKS